MDIGGFKWEPGVTPLSTPGSLAIGVAVYLVTVFGLKLVIRNPVTLPTWIAATHNLILCIGSLIMFIGTAYESAQVASDKNSIRWLFCLEPGTPMKGALYFWSYTYYLSKYYEFLDTVLLVLKAKPLSFLHVFHHSVVVVMSFLWLDAAQSLQQIALLTNTGIHVLMYYYYFMCTIKRPPRWKKLVTQSQIIQFVFSFAASVPFWWMHATSQGCSGFGAIVFNAVFNFLLLLLFRNFHRISYSSKKRT
ncbi:Putative elongation of fatty acids protein DDB_G0272012 [Coccomyxa sp. Obi]|nr:Putative elongation of fatty acids protein DDB_G0272012 [Coccomyxa sp. Obi]